MRKILPLLLLLAACAPAQKEYPPRSSGKTISLSAKKEVAFSMPTVGAYSMLEVPENVEIIPSSRFVESQEPTFAQRIGNQIGEFKFEEFCTNRPDSLYLEDDIIIDCKFVEKESPHIEFYFAQYNIYTNDYFLIGKYALFKTHSKVYPALLVHLPKTQATVTDFSNRDAVSAFIESSRTDPEDETFDTFVRSIVVEPLKAESEWLKYSDSKLGFSMDFPRGMGEPFPIAYGTGVTIGVDGYYSITFYEDKKDLEESIPGIKQLQSRRVTRSAKRIGNYDAEEIIIENLEHGFTTHSVVIDTRKGHFVLHYQPQISGDPYVAHMLSSFRILDDQQNLPL